MKQVPSTVVLAGLCLLIAVWPSVQLWAEMDSVHHFLVHGLYLISGGLFGLQTSWWLHEPATLPMEETGVSS